MCWRESAANWLYGVALRGARVQHPKLRRPVARARGGRHGQNRVAAGGRLCGTVRLMDEELHRLPERYWQPLLLCYLEGQKRAIGRCSDWACRCERCIAALSAAWHCCGRG